MSAKLNQITAKRERDEFIERVLLIHTVRGRSARSVKVDLKMLRGRVMRRGLFK
jgi:hypothetical protein